MGYAGLLAAAFGLWLMAFDTVFSTRGPLLRTAAVNVLLAKPLAHNLEVRHVRRAGRLGVQRVALSR